MALLTKSLSAALLTGLTVLIGAPALAKYKGDPIAAMELQELFKKFAQAHNIPMIAPMMSVDNMHTLLERGKSSGSSTYYLDREMNFRADRLIRNGFNLVVMTCPGDKDSKHLPQGIMMTKITATGELDFHLERDEDTAPQFNSDKKRQDIAKREFSYVSIGNTLARITENTLEDLRSTLFKDNILVKGKISKPTPEMIQIMIDEYKKACGLHI